MSITTAWAGWVLATTLGWAATGALAAFSNDLNSSLGLALVAIGQWAALRRWLHGGGMWVLATYVAGFAGSLLGAGLIGLLGWTVAAGRVTAGWNLLLWAVQGAVVGGVQAFLLRRQVAGAGWWVAANALGFALASPLPRLLRGGPMEAMVSMGLFGLVSSAVSGAALVRLFRERLAD